MMSDLTSIEQGSSKRVPIVLTSPVEVDQENVAGVSGKVQLDPY